MIRKSSIRRSALPKRKKPVNRVNRVRRAKNWGRAYGSPGRVAFVASLPCIVASAFSPCAGKIENHHTENGGRGRKADAATVVPLCTRHHHNLHQFGARHFESVYGVDLEAEAARTETRWRTAAGDVPAPAGAGRREGADTVADSRQLSTNDTCTFCGFPVEEHRANASGNVMHPRRREEG